MNISDEILLNNLLKHLWQIERKKPPKWDKLKYFYIYKIRNLGSHVWKYINQMSLGVQQKYFVPLNFRAKDINYDSAQF